MRVALLLLMLEFLEGVKVFSPLFLRLILSRIELNIPRSGMLLSCEWDVSEKVVTADGEVVIRGMLAKFVCLA